MRATHTDYKHPKHLRVEDGGEVYCLAPSHSQYSRLNKSGLPSHTLPPAPLKRPIVMDYGQERVIR